MNTVLPKKGDKVKFTQYAQMEEGVEPVFKTGDVLTITEVLTDEAGKFSATREDGAGDTVFDDEFEPLPVEAAAPRSRAKAAPKAEATTTVAETAAAAPAATKPAKATKAKAAPVAETAPATAPVAAKPKGKAAKAKAAETAPVAAPARVKDEHEMEIVDTESVTAALQDQDAHEAAKALVAQAEETYFTLGGVFAHIYYEGSYKKLGYTSNKGFSEYLDTEIGVGYRKAMFLINIYTYFTGLGVDEKRLSEIGWSKAKELVNVATTENFDELVDFAADHTRDELQAEIKENYVKAKNDGETGTASTKAKKVTFKFVAFSDQAATVRSALDTAKALSNSEDDNAALLHIVTEWALMTDGVEVPLEQAVQALRTRYGVEINLKAADAEAEQVGEPQAETATAPKATGTRKKKAA